MHAVCLETGQSMRNHVFCINLFETMEISKNMLASKKKAQKLAIASNWASQWEAL